MYFFYKKIYHAHTQHKYLLCHCFFPCEKCMPRFTSGPRSLMVSHFLGFFGCNYVSMKLSFCNIIYLFVEFEICLEVIQFQHISVLRSKEIWKVLNSLIKNWRLFDIKLSTWQQQTICLSLQGGAYQRCVIDH